MIKITYSFNKDEMIKKLDKNNIGIETLDAGLIDDLKKEMLDAELRYRENKLKIEKQYTEESVRARKEFEFYWNKKEKTTMNDNVKKVFEMLDVEPNERFMLKNSSCKYYIKEDLSIVNDSPPADYSLKLQCLLNGNIKIIKLPKELTFEELMNWKPKLNEEYHYVDSCNHVKTNKNECWVIDEQIIEHNKPYPTREMAERRKDIKDKYKELGHQFSIEEWQDTNIYKWTLLINHNSKRLSVASSRNIGYSKYTFLSFELGVKFMAFLGKTEQEQYENACLYL